MKIDKRSGIVNDPNREDNPQYQVKIDKRSGIVNDPNREDNPQFIIQLIGKIITVSLETLQMVEGLPALKG